MQITDMISMIRDLAWYIFWPFSAFILNNAGRNEGNHISLWLSPYAADFRMLLGYNVMKNVYVTQYTSDINVFWLAFFRPDVLKFQCSLKGPLTCTKLFTAALRRYIFRTFTFSCLAPSSASRPKVGRAVVDLHLRHQEQEVGGGRDAGGGRRVSPPLRLLVMQLWGRARCAVAAAVTQRWMEWRPRVELENDPQCNVCQSS